MSRFSCYGVVDPGNPEAAGICDRGGEVRKRRELLPEMEWRGDRLAWNGFLVCRRHMDRPQPQDRARHLPADPIPVRNPRPDLDFVQPGATGAGILDGVFITDGTQPANPTETAQLDVSVPDVQALQGADGLGLTGADGAPLDGPDNGPLPPDGSSWFAP